MINCSSTGIRSFEKSDVFHTGVGFPSPRHTLYSGHRCFGFSDWSRAAADTGREGKTMCLRKLHPHSSPKKNFTTRKELLAIVRFSRQYRHYLLGRKFFIRSDHNSLT